MTTLREEFEALMPEPADYVIDEGTISVVYPACDYAKKNGFAIYTADQVREAMKAVAERCARPVPMITTLFSVPGTLLFKSTDGKWFYQNHANTWQSCPAFVSQDKNAFAAAIRAQAGGDQT